MLNARSVYRRVAILHSLQPERPITTKIRVRSSSSSQCKILPRVPHAASSFQGLILIRIHPYEIALSVLLQPGSRFPNPKATPGSCDKTVTQPKSPGPDCEIHRS